MHPTRNLLVETMLNPDFYGHPVDRVEMVETHASWVFLAGDYAYKVKKPVDFGFLNFSTLEKRHHFCHEELRLNRRFAPRLYLEVVSIGGPPHRLRLNAEPVCDYAVRMRRFPARLQLDRLHAEGLLTVPQMEAFAALLARVHQQAAVVAAHQPYGTPERIMAPVRQNFSQLKPLLPADLRSLLQELSAWSEQCGLRCKPLMRQRRTQGFIRECHGDVHLGNMAWFEETPLLFDCIEFNADLRWIDLVNDLAFLIMDLEDREEETLGWHVLNRYLRETGDYPGIALLDFYKLYRAMVRAKVIGLRLSQPHLKTAEQGDASRLLRSYLDLAAGYTRTRSPRLLITHGFSGSGKTTLASALAPLCGAVHLQSDIERKRLHGLTSTAASHSAVGAGLYGENATAATYQHLQALAAGLLQAGFSVIVDATFLRRRWRSAMCQLARQQQVPLKILDFPLTPGELERRLNRREAQTAQTSEADRAVLAYQRTHQDPLTPDEHGLAFVVSPVMTAAGVAAQLG